MVGGVQRLAGGQWWVWVGGGFGLVWLAVGRCVAVALGQAVAFELFWLALGRLMSAGLAKSPNGFLFSSLWQAKTSSGRTPMAAHATNSAVANLAAIFLLLYSVNYAGSYLSDPRARCGASTGLGDVAHLHLLCGQQHLQSGTWHFVTLLTLAVNAHHQQ